MNKIIGNLTLREKTEFNEMINKVKSILLTKCGYDMDKDNIRYELNKAFRTTLGDCERHRNYGSYDWTDIKIRINHKLFTEHRDIAMNTLAHEYCHALQKGTGHDNSFYRVASEINRKTDFNINRTSVNPTAIRSKYKYELTCVGCGYTVKRRKESKFVKNTKLYRCGLCGGNFEVTKI